MIVREESIRTSKGQRREAGGVDVDPVWTGFEIQMLEDTVEVIHGPQCGLR